MVIIDPANIDNNVAARIQPDERDPFVVRLAGIRDHLLGSGTSPQRGDDLAWKELFGSNFSID